MTNKKVSIIMCTSWIFPGKSLLPLVCLCVRRGESPPPQWRSEGLQRPGANAWSGAPPPVWGENPASALAGGGGESTSKQKNGLQHEKVETQGDRGPLKARDPEHMLLLLLVHCNELTLLICLGLIFFLKFAPTSWAGP